MAILGHSNISIMLGTYTYVDEDSRRDARERLPRGRNLIPAATPNAGYRRACDVGTNSPTVS